MSFARALAASPMSQTSLAGSSVARLLRLAAPAALLTGLALGLGGCLINPGANYKETRVSEVAAAAGSAVRVESRNGSISVRKAERSDVRISAELRATSAERLKAAVIRAERDASGTLVIDTVWPDGGRQSSEGVTFNIELPEAAGVTLESSNGSLTVAGLRGEAKLTTSNGSIIAREHAGALRARTTNGSIDLLQVSGPIDAESSNGSAEVVLSDDNAGPVRVDTYNGDVRITLGAAFKGTLSARTSNGSVTMPAGATQASKTSASLTLSEGPASTVTTSNGSVTVKKN
jgi:DUF4097 and DUF4098 domain-containing protein YvlB